MINMKRSKEEPIYTVRTLAEVREAIFDEIDAVRSGRSDPARGRAVASDAKKVLKEIAGFMPRRRKLTRFYR
jgi:hypothetical protein